MGIGPIPGAESGTLQAMSQPSRERSELRTILTADIEGFSSQMREDQEGVIRLLVDSYYLVAEREAEKYGGTLFRKEGDAVWLSFQSVLGAVRAGIGIQEAMLRRNLQKSQGGGIHLRMGIHLGDVVLTQDGEILGHTLSVAKRLETQSEADSICLSEEVFRQVRNKDFSFDFQSLGEIDLKGVGPLEVFQGTIQPDRLEVLRRGEASQASFAGPRIVVAADGNRFGSDLSARAKWEREALKKARDLGSELFLGNDGIVFALFEVTEAKLALEFVTSLPGPRQVVRAGEVLLQRGEDGRVEKLFGEVVEAVLDGISRAGLEPGAILIGPQVLEALGHPSSGLVEPAGFSMGPRKEPAYRYLPAGGANSRFGLSHAPVGVSVLVGGEEPGIVDLAGGSLRGVEQATPRGDLAGLWKALGQVSPHAKKAAPVLSNRAYRLLEEQPESGLGIAGALFSSLEGQLLPPRLVMLGEVLSDGRLVLPEDFDPAQAQAILARVGGGTLLSPPGALANLPRGFSGVDVETLAEAFDWIRRSGAGSHLDTLVRAQRKKTLSLVVFSPSGDLEEADALAQEIQAEAELEDPSPNLYRLLEEAEEELGRKALVQRCQEWIRKRPSSEMPDLYRALQPKVLAYLFPDARMQGWDRSQENPTRVLALGGTLEDAESLRLTEADFDRVLGSLAHLDSEVRAALSHETLVLLGCKAGDPQARAFYRQLRLNIPATSAQSTFLVAPDSDPKDHRWWERRGVRVLEESPGFLLDSLVTLAEQGGDEFGPEGGRSVDRPLTSPRSPYKFLDFYGFEDRTIFFGRDKEMREVMTRLVTHPVLVFYGRSGAGKTSLLQAGILSRLPRPRNLVISLRALSDPTQLIRDELLALAASSARPRLEELSLAELTLEVARCISGRLILLLDQFEEFFIRLDAATRLRFTQEVAELVRRLPERVHLVFSLREDFLAEMAEFEAFLPSVLDNRYRLNLLTKEQAREAIVGPAKLFGIEFEETLVESLLQELFLEGIDPPQLQIVLDRLYHSRDPQSQRISQKIFEGLGGVKDILIGYLQSTLNEDLKEHRDLARSMLKTMVTERGTKAVVEVSEIARRLNQPPEDIRLVLDRLLEARLVRSLNQGEEHLFELAHEYIIQEVQSWDSDVEISIQHARMVLRSSLHNWQRFGSLLGPELLTIVAKERSHLEITRDAQAMLLRASALHHRPLEPWLQSERERISGVPALIGFLKERKISAIVKRSILDSLFDLPLSEAEVQVALTAMQKVGNPSLLSAMRFRAPASNRERLFEAFERAVVERFFGPERMTYVPPGPAMLGSTRTEKEERIEQLRADLHWRIESERPQQEVFVPGYWMDRTMVTNEEYAEFHTDHVYRFPPEESDHPAVYVSWYDAKNYAKWCGKEIPSEEQWEKAARGSKGALFPWGDVFDSELCNSAECGLRRTTSVHAFPEGKSPYGCLNMAGNVWEWTASPWEEGSPFKVQKGGSTVSFKPHQFAATRFEGFPDFILQWVGFRTCTSKNPIQDSKSTRPPPTEES